MFRSWKKIRRDGRDGWSTGGFREQQNWKGMWQGGSSVLSMNNSRTKEEKMAC